MSTGPGPRPLRLSFVAAAGYGKTTALLAALPPDGVRVSARQALDIDLDGLTAAPAIGVDDLEALDPAEEEHLAARLAELPPSTGLVLASRRLLGERARRLLRGPLVERGCPELRLSAPAVGQVLAEQYDVRDPETGQQVHALTGGWATLVHLAADAVAQRPDQPVRPLVCGPDSPVLAWLVDHVLAALSEGAASLLRTVGGAGPVTSRVAEAVAAALGLPDPAGHLEELVRSGVLLGVRTSTGGERLDVVPAVVPALSLGVDREPAERRKAAVNAAAVAYERDQLWVAAARSRALAGDGVGLRRLVHDHSEAMLRQGGARDVVALCEGLLDGDRLVQRTWADALRLSGEPAAALRAFQPLVEVAQREGWTRELASRVAAVHHTWGDYAETLRVLDHGLRATLPTTPGEEVEHVEWLAFRARALVMLGRRAAADPLAVAALAAADRLGAPRAVAAAHLAMARVTDGARKEAHHEQARLAAAAEGDVVTAALVLVNQCYLELVSARFTDAARTGRQVVRIAERCCPPGRRVAALHNLGEALTRLGELDEALWHLRRAVALARTLGPGATAVGLLGVAEIHRQRGQDEQAHAAYLEAVALARQSEERQVLVPALAGAARAQAPSAADEALALAEEAGRLATDVSRPTALTALGWVLLVRGDRPAAAEAAGQAVQAARTAQVRDRLAEALELAAVCAPDGETAESALTEALTIWRDGGAAPAAARVEVLLGGLDGADASARARARAARRRLDELGVAGAVLPVAVRVDRTVRIAVLGGFGVTVDGAPVPHTAWRSRQARTLMKILAARRGVPISRERLCEHLWPDDPARTGHRLSVLLTTLRGVLDPGKRKPAEWYVAADLDRVWLDLAHCQVDADDLVKDAEHAAELLEAGQDDRAADILADVDARYTGDAFDDERGEEWAHHLREAARAAWTRSVRNLVSLRRRSGRAADTHGLLVRLLATDPYDEQAHRLLVRTLVRTGRHGEARRAFQHWVEAMREIDAPPPDPGQLFRPVPAARHVPTRLVLTSR